MLRQIGRYELLEEIGHGGMATVYRGRDSQLDREVAVKVMHPHLRKTPEARARFVREAKSVARLQHRNILEIYDNSDERSDDAYIVTELLTGPTLKAFREGIRDMPAEVAVCIAIEVAAALEAAHAAGVVHRDVKPENVLLHNSRCIKLTDFGIAQMVDAQSFTATGQILGSPGHMAPEQIESGSSDARTDVFALGTVLYYLATGRLPFAGDNPHQVLRKVVEGDFVEPIRAAPAIGASLSALVSKSLAHDAEERFATMGDMMEALSSWLARHGVDDSAELMARFLAEPVSVAQATQTKAVAQSLQLAQRAAKAKETPVALDHLNRALALDPGNQRAHDLLRRVTRQAQGRTALWVSGALMGIFGVVVLGVVAAQHAWTSPEPVAGGGADGAGRQPLLAAGAASGGAQSGLPVSAHAAAGSRTGSSDTGAPTRQPDAGVQNDSSGATTQPVQRVVRNGGGDETATGATRQVCFAPNPRNVTLALDGEPPRAFSRESQCRTVTVGGHEVRAIGAEGCCDTLVAGFRAEAGVGVQQVPLRLRFKASRLYVNLRSERSVPPNGTVLLDDGVRGATRQFLEVPMDTFRRRHGYRVEVPGYAPYRGVAELIAGAQVQATVQLEALPE